jgi:hypothetical protein
LLRRRQGLAFTSFDPAMQRGGNEKNWDRNWVVRRHGWDFKLKRLHVEATSANDPPFGTVQPTLPGSFRFCALAFDHPLTYAVSKNSKSRNYKNFRTFEPHEFRLVLKR